MRSVDVVILGDGLAGLSLALQLKQRVADARVAILACGPASESNGLPYEWVDAVTRDYLAQVSNLSAPIRSLAVRFGSIDGPPGAGGELYAVDGPRLLSELRAAVEQTMPIIPLERLEEVQLSGAEAPHRILGFSKERFHLQTRWIVDATAGGSALGPRIARAPSDSTFHTTYVAIDSCAAALDAVIQVPLAACSVTLGPRSTGGISALVSAQGQRTYSEVTHLLRCLDEAGMLLSLGKGNPDLTLHSLSHFQPRQSFAIPGQRFPACATERWAFVAEACGLGQEACGTSPLFISANCIVTELVRLDRAGSLTREAAVHWNQWYLEHVRDASSSAALRMQAGGDGLIASVHHLWELAHARFRHEFQYRELLFKNPSNRRVHTRLLELAPTLVRQGQTHERMQLLIRQWIERIRDRPGVRIAAPQRLPSLEQEPHGSPRGTLDDRMRSYEVGLLLCDELAQDLFRLALAN